MWVYKQKTGEIGRALDGRPLDLFTFDNAGIFLGYAGRGEGKNNPALQHVQGVGPIPCGDYSIGAPHNTTEHGPFVLGLTPAPANQMFGRSGFLIHGDSLTAPGSASHGCIILPRAVRERIAASGDTQLRVIA